MEKMRHISTFLVYLVCIPLSILVGIIFAVVVLALMTVVTAITSLSTLVAVPLKLLTRLHLFLNEDIW